MEARSRPTTTARSRISPLTAPTATPTSNTDSRTAQPATVRPSIQTIPRCRRRAPSVMRRILSPPARTARSATQAAREPRGPPAKQTMTSTTAPSRTAPKGRGGAQPATLVGPNTRERWPAPLATTAQRPSTTGMPPPPANRTADPPTPPRPNQQQAVPARPATKERSTRLNLKLAPAVHAMVQEERDTPERWPAPLATTAQRPSTTGMPPPPATRTADPAPPTSPNQQQAVPARPASKERSTRLNLKLAPAVHAMVQEERGTPERWPAPLAMTAQRPSTTGMPPPPATRTADPATPTSPNQQQAVPARPATKERSTRLNLKLAPAVHAMVQEERDTPERWRAPLATTAQRPSTTGMPPPPATRTADPATPTSPNQQQAVPASPATKERSTRLNLKLAPAVHAMVQEERGTPERWPAPLAMTAQRPSTTGMPPPPATRTADPATPTSPNQQQAVPARPATKERSTRLNLKLAPAVHAMVQEERDTPERWPAPLATTAQRPSTARMPPPPATRTANHRPPISPNRQQAVPARPATKERSTRLNLKLAPAVHAMVQEERGTPERWPAPLAMETPIRLITTGSRLRPPVPAVMSNSCTTEESPVFGATAARPCMTPLRSTCSH